MEHGNYEEAIQVVNHFLSSSPNPLIDLGIDPKLAHASFRGIERGNTLLGLRRQDEVDRQGRGILLVNPFKIPAKMVAGQKDSVCETLNRKSVGSPCKSRSRCQNGGRPKRFSL
ncbi:hypothetical protein AMTRI_Chr10g230930 [Amborella trichopoda]